ncbi:MAG: flagellar hook basal-body protein [Firmicutes bacterium]|nr:flagellar hook basal-body protein [Bacillota bacterium]
MFSVMHLAGDGLQVQNDLLSSVSANLANSETPGYGARQAGLATQAVRMVRPANDVLAQQTLPPNLTQGQGAYLAQDQPVFSNNTTSTGISTNLAISGNGFFVVKLPNGHTAYTRAGNFVPNAQGQLVLPSGATLLNSPSVTDGQALSAAPNGILTVNNQPAGQIMLAVFPNPQGLTDMGGNLYQTSAASGAPTLVAPGTGTAGSLENGAVNASATNIVASMVSLAQAQSYYALDAKLLNVAHTVNQAAINMTT